MFVVREKVEGVYPYAYRIKDLLDEDVAGTFYEQELQKYRNRPSFELRESFVGKLNEVSENCQ